jgi:hypothetical protein
MMKKEECGIELEQQDQERRQNEVIRIQLYFSNERINTTGWTLIRKKVCNQYRLTVMESLFHFLVDAPFVSLLVLVM